jgi:hypothetical protein
MSISGPIKATSVELVAVQPERSDAERLQILRDTQDAPVKPYYYLVKVYLDKKPPVRSEAADLYVGNEPISKYWGFVGGLYFKVYDLGFLDSHAGETLQMSLDGITREDLGAILPPIPEQVMDEALKVSDLPTKQEALSR